MQYIINYSVSLVGLIS